MEEYLQLAQTLQTAIDDAFFENDDYQTSFRISNIYIRTSCLGGCKNSLHMQVSIILNYWHVQKKDIFIAINGL
jgi:hypothetical protein